MLLIPEFGENSGGYSFDPAYPLRVQPSATDVTKRNLMLGAAMATGALPIKLLLQPVFANHADLDSGIDLLPNW